MSKRCERCGGSTAPVADDYFIPKCHCDDLQDLEGDDDESEEFR